MSENQSTSLTDPELAQRLRRTAADLAVERERATAASEGLEHELRDLADDLWPADSFDERRTMDVGLRMADQGRVS